MSIVSKKLCPTAVIEYLSEILDQINVGGEDVSRVLGSGVISALVPDCTPDNRLYDFRHGGVLAPADMSVVGETVVLPVANTAEFLARVLVQFVGQDCLIHEPLKQLGEASKADGEPLLVEDSLFYMNRHCFQSVAECQKTVRRNTLSWHFLLLVGRYPQPENLSLKSIVLNSTCIVVGAYDGESYLVWRPD